MMTQLLNIFRRNLLKKLIMLIAVVNAKTGTISVAEGGHLARRFDEKTLAAKIRPAFVGKEDKIFDKFLSKWRDDK